MKKIVIVNIIFCAIISFCVGFMIITGNASAASVGKVALLKSSDNVETVSESMEKNVTTGAQSMILIEGSTNRILNGKNAHAKRYMASTTKIMTAITVLENTKDINKIIKVPAAAVGVEGSSIYLALDEEISIKDLLYGLMLQSGNDCAAALAITTGGSVKDFAKMMNEQAYKIGAKSSNFVTPHGLHDDNHYTTAYDLAIISSYALKNPTFKEIVSTKSYTCKWFGKDYNRIIKNKNKILSTFEGGDGVKTGFTKKAGRCLVSSATRDGMQLICVVLNCGPMFEDCSSLMEEGFSRYKLQTIIGENESFKCDSVANSRKKEINASTMSNIALPVTDKEAEQIVKVAEFNENLTAPIKKGTEVGNLKIYLSKQLLFTQKLYSIDNIDCLNVFDKLHEIVDNWNKF